MLAKGPLLVVRSRPDERTVDCVVIHEGECVRDGIVGGSLRHVLEHVLRRELELLVALTVPQVRCKELIGGRHIGEWQIQHGVDDPDVGKSGHEARVGPELKRVLLGRS